MIKEILQSINGVELYPIISLFLFVIMFLYVLVSVMRMKQSDIEHARGLPLENSELGRSELNNVNRQSADSGE